jgi:hypothetical protein
VGEADAQAPVTFGARRDPGGRVLRGDALAQRAGVERDPGEDLKLARIACDRDVGAGARPRAAVPDAADLERVVVAGEQHDGDRGQGLEPIDRRLEHRPVHLLAVEHVAGDQHQVDPELVGEIGDARDAGEALGTHHGGTLARLRGAQAELPVGRVEDPHRSTSELPFDAVILTFCWT